MQGNFSSNQHSLFPTSEHSQPAPECLPNYVKIPTDGADVWEIDASLLKFENKVGSGSFGDLWVLLLSMYRLCLGSCMMISFVLSGIKAHIVVRRWLSKSSSPTFLHKDMLTEFAQEVFIMRSVRYTFICVVCTMHWLVPTQSTNYFFWFLVFIPWYSWLVHTAGTFSLTEKKIAFVISLKDLACIFFWGLHRGSYFYNGFFSYLGQIFQKRLQASLLHQYAITHKKFHLAPPEEAASRLYEL